MIPSSLQLLQKNIWKGFCTVLSWIWLAILRLQSAKCEFFKVSVIYLGHIISHEGVPTNGRKVKAIKNWPVPITVTELRSFLGFTNIDALLRAMQNLLTPLMIKSPETILLINEKDSVDRWMSGGFDTLKVGCTSAPILAFADFNKPFKLQTNASAIRLGAILYQKRDGKDRVIGYASRAL